MVSFGAVVVEPGLERTFYGELRPISDKFVPVALGKNLTPFPKPGRQAQLVRHGIYSMIRHPLYASLMAGAIGWALVWQSWPALVLAALLIPFFIAKSRREERWLRDQFPEYADYERQVRGFVPWR